MAKHHSALASLLAKGHCHRFNAYFWIADDERFFRHQDKSHRCRIQHPAYSLPSGFLLLPIPAALASYTLISGKLPSGNTHIYHAHQYENDHESAAASPARRKNDVHHPVCREALCRVLLAFFKKGHFSYDFYINQGTTISQGKPNFLTYNKYSSK